MGKDKRRSLRVLIETNQREVEQLRHLETLHSDVHAIETALREVAEALRGCGFKDVDALSHATVQLRHLENRAQHLSDPKAARIIGERLASLRRVVGALAAAEGAPVRAVTPAFGAAPRLESGSAL